MSIGVLNAQVQTGVIRGILSYSTVSFPILLKGRFKENGINADLESNIVEIIKKKK